MNVKSSRTLTWAVALLVLFSLPAPALSQESHVIEVGDIAIHYNAIPTTMLTPEVARQYGITRSSGRSLLNVSVLRKQEGMPAATPATVTAAATNLNGQRQDLRVREVREGEAIYYLAEARFQDAETLTFDLEITPEGSSEAIRTRFQQQFFAQ